MIPVLLCHDPDKWDLHDLQHGGLNPDAVALVELLDTYEDDTRPTIARVTLTSGQLVFVVLQGGQITSDIDERKRRCQQFLTELAKAKSPLAAM